MRNWHSGCPMRMKNFFISPLCRLFCRTILLPVALSALYFLIYWGLGKFSNTFYLAVDINRALQVYALAWVVFVYYKALSRNPPILIVALFGVAVLFMFLLQRQYMPYTYDISAQMGNIYYYATNMRIPSAGDWGEASQPPLYYATAAMVHRFAKFFSPHYHVWPGVIAYSFFLYLMFLLYGILSLLHFIRWPYLRFIGTAALMFWPANIVHCSRLGNDIMQYLAFAACTYHFARWYRFSEPRQLNMMLVWLGVSFATKNSVVVLLLGIALLVARKYWPFLSRRHGRAQLAQRLGTLSYARHIKPLRVGLVILALGVALSFGRNLWNMAENHEFVLIGGMRQPQLEWVFVPEQFKFDFDSFIRYPYAYNKVYGNDRYTLHMMLRSFSFAEYTWNGQIQAIFLNALMLSMWCFLIAGLLYHWRRRAPLPRLAGFYATFFFCCVVALYIAKMYYIGIYIWADTRHLFTMMIYFVLAYLALLNGYRRSNRRLYALGCGLFSAYVYIALLHDGLQLVMKVDV